MRYQTRAELSDHIDQEGIYYFFTDYGIDAEDAPDDETKVAVQKVKDALVPFEAAVNELFKLIDPEGEGCWS
jgi:hypothetical protein